MASKGYLSNLPITYKPGILLASYHKVFRCRRHTGLRSLPACCSCRQESCSAVPLWRW